MATVRHCPRCDTDYRPEILTCAECGEALQLREEEAPPPAAAEPPPGDYRSLYFSERIEDLEPLAEELSRWSARAAAGRSRRRTRPARAAARCWKTEDLKGGRGILAERGYAQLRYFTKITSLRASL